MPKTFVFLLCEFSFFAVKIIITLGVGGTNDFVCSFVIDCVYIYFSHFSVGLIGY